MFISEAYAQAAPQGASVGEAFAWNMGLVLVLVLLFYILLIRPQQKRFKEHSDMLSQLKKGDAVITGGGLVGKIDKIKDGENEVTVDLGNGLKVKAMRATLQSKEDVRVDSSKDEEKKK